MKHTLLLLLLCCGTAHAGKYYDFDARTREAYRMVVNLRWTEAQTALEQLAREQPDNLSVPFVQQFRYFLQVLIDDDKQAYRQFSADMPSRIDMFSRGDGNSPWRLYCQAEARLQWAVLELRFGDQLAALSDIKQAYALLENNRQHFPDFMPNLKSLGILHTLIGNVPEEYRWVVKAASGMSGSISQGLSELESVMAWSDKNDFLFEQETLAAYALLELHLNNEPEKAWNLLKNNALSPRESPLAAYVTANVALKSGHTDEAIRILQQSPSGTGVYPFHYRNFLLGVAKLYRLDLDAHLPLQDFVKYYPGKNVLKEAYQKLAWFHLINGNEQGYRTYMDFVKTRGTDQSDPDQVALREARSGEIPDPRLLRARLLFDGGYYQRAYELLKDAAADYAGNSKNSLEYVYRMGRIAHKSGRWQEAEQQYTATIENGSAQPWYFACNAALQLGLLKEERRDLTGAVEAYRRCLSLHPQEYASSLHARAKAGLQRCQN